MDKNILIGIKIMLFRRVGNITQSKHLGGTERGFYAIRNYLHV